MTVRSYREADRAEWLRMRAALWPGSSAEEAAQDADAWLTAPGTFVLVAEREDRPGLAGFAEAGERAYADGCDTSPVAYLEGWYVEPASCGTGVGRALVRAVERWAAERGRTELASDCALANSGGQTAHEAVGFMEVERTVNYRKPLSPSRDGA